MEQKLLHKLFSGKATSSELSHIRRWVNESEANRKTFFRERALFDAIQLNDTLYKQPAHKLSFTLFKWIGGIAAAVIIALFALNSINGFRLSETPEPIAFNTIKVPAGQRVELTLADGTHVWLNARSELSYPTVFDAKKREVTLKGKAFFNVAKNPDKKFVVNAGRCELEVLGTQFNVEAYEDDEFSAALMCGSLKVTDKSQPDESVLLTPNNAVSLNDDQLEVTPITDFSPYSWREGLIVFKEIRFKELMKELEKNFGVRIIIENSRLDQYACSGKLRISDGIDAALHALQQDAHFTFERENGTEIHIK